jgi:sugar/nucleoside kinase (ribokinase family)
MIAPDGLALAATALANGVKSLVVTLGARGVAYFAAPGFETLADVPRRAAGAPRTARAESLGAIRTQLVPSRIAQVVEDGDPTGCGDVWGATYFSHLAAGNNFQAAMGAAMEAAARNVEHRGASGLAHYLRRELSTT